MDEKEFEEMIDKKFKYYLEPIMDFIDTQKAIRDFNLSDKSTAPKAFNTSTKFSVEYNGDTYTYTKNKKCKYCEEHYTAWKQPYEQGDRPIAVDYDGNVIEGGCPKYN